MTNAMSDMNLLEAEVHPGRTRFDSVVVGWLTEVGSNNKVLVDFPGNPSPTPLPALTTASVAGEAAACRVALAFENGDPERPVVLGVIREPAPEERTKSQTGSMGGPTPTDSFQRGPDSGRSELDRHVTVEADGERVVLSAGREIVLRCGSASITLTRAGKVLVRGKYLLSRSSGVNRIKGGSVQIN